MDKQKALETARKYLRNENFKKAKEAYLEALKTARTDKERAVIWAELSWTFYHLKSYQSSIEAAENCLEYDPEYQPQEDIYRVMGFSHLALGQDDKAIENLQKSLKIDRHSLKQQFAIYELGKLYFKKQAYKEAEALFKEVETQFYQNNKDYYLSVLYMTGFIRYYQGDLQEAENIFEEMLENAPDKARQAMALFGLAFIAFERKDYLKTINLCESVARLDENFYDKETLGFLTAASFHYLGRNDVFEKYYQQMVKSYPNGRYRRELEEIKSKISN
jgi:tetratricopeptide (TPR) repeat protein